MFRCLLLGGFQRKSDGVNTLFYIYLHNIKGVREIALFRAFRLWVFRILAIKREGAN